MQPGGLGLQHSWKALLEEEASVVDHLKWAGKPDWAQRFQVEFRIQGPLLVENLQQKSTVNKNTTNNKITKNL